LLCRRHGRLHHQATLARAILFDDRKVGENPDAGKGGIAPPHPPHHHESRTHHFTFRILPDRFFRIGELVGKDLATIQEFSLKFVVSAEKGLTEIEAALTHEDMTALAALGHRMKSAARMAGAQSFAELCQELEQGKHNAT